VDLAAHRPSAIRGYRESFLAHHFGQFYFIEITRAVALIFKEFTSKTFYRILVLSAEHKKPRRTGGAQLWIQ
jgi:hypothetical protein